jgi:uroporphyrinogen-III synthase
MRVLITRPFSEAQALSEMLKDLGFETCISPVMEIVPREVEISRDKTYRAVVLTSGNAVEALVGAELPRDIPIFCVGDATARRLAGTAFSDIRSASGNSDDLVALITRDLEPDDAPLLYLSGMMIAADIGAALADAGFTVERHVVYRAQAVATPNEAVVAALAAGEIDAVLFYSPRSARIFLDHLKAAKLGLMAKEMIAYCISNAAADVARNLQWRKVVVASRPTQNDLLALLPKS